jgi:hypothetical protein
MSQALTAEGTFRGRIIEYGVQESSDTASQSMGVAIKCAIDEAYNFDAQAWEDWRSYECECYGYVNLVKKDGTPNDKSAENFCKCSGWNGSISDLAVGEFKPEPIQFSTKGEEYKGKTSFKVSFINPYDSTPGGGIKSVDESKAKQLQAKYGSQFRALAGAAKKSAPAGGKPPAPPARKPEPAKTAPLGDADIPF